MNLFLLKFFLALCFCLQQFQSAIDDQVIVQITKLNREVETKYFSGKLEFFEFISTNVLHIYINVTTGFEKRTSFTLHFYGKY